MTESTGRPPRRSLPSGTLIAFALLICAVFASVSLFLPVYFLRLAGYPEQATSASTGNTPITACVRRSIVRAGGLAGYLRHPHHECPPRPEDDPTRAILLCYATLAVTTAGYYWFRSNRHARRHGVRPLAAERHPRADAELRALVDAHLPGRRIRFLVNVLDRGVNGMAFGRVGRRAVILSRGLLDLASSGDPRDHETFRAVVRHELAHLRNRDLDITQITLALGRCYALLVLAPILPGVLIGVIFLPPPAGTASRVLLADVVALAVLIVVARGAVLRSRELEADARAVRWQGDAAPLRRALATRPPPPAGAGRPDPLARLWAARSRLTGTHPPVGPRLRCLDDPAEADRPRAGIAFVLGFCLPMIWDPYSSFTAYTQVGGVRRWWPAPVLSTLLGVALVLILLRAARHPTADGAGRSRVPFRSGLALGVFCGGIALPSVAFDGMILPGVRPAVEIAARVIPAALGWLFVVWCGYLVDEWAPAIGTSRRPGIRTGVLCVLLCLVLLRVAPPVFGLAWQDVFTEFTSPRLRALPALLMSVAWAQGRLMVRFQDVAWLLAAMLVLAGLPLLGRIGRERPAPLQPAAGTARGGGIGQAVVAGGLAMAAAGWFVREWFGVSAGPVFLVLVGLPVAVGVWVAGSPRPHPVARAGRWAAPVAVLAAIVTLPVSRLTVAGLALDVGTGVQAAVLAAHLRGAWPWLRTRVRPRVGTG